MKITSIITILAMLLFSCSTKNKAVKTSTVNDSMPLSNEEVVDGLKEALKVATNNSTDHVSKTDGYLKDTSLFIPFPPQAEKMKEKLVKLGLKDKVTEFETSINQAATDAATKSAPIFNKAIDGMDVTEAFSILNGSDTAATHYLRMKTTPILMEQLKPVVKLSIEKLKVTSYWNPLMTAYNKIPFVEKQNPDLEEYITRLMIQGLFKLISKEEIKIRKNPAARVSKSLIRVFGHKGS